MSDIMRPIPFGRLMDWILTEYRAHGSVFGVTKLVRHTNGQALPIFAEKIESPQQRSVEPPGTQVHPACPEPGGGLRRRKPLF